MAFDDAAMDPGLGADRERRRAEHAVTRLEAFSDGVFAIAATLLVLDLTVGELGEVASDAELWTGLVDLTPSIVSFVVSFLILGLLWWIHVRAFDDIVRVDRVFVGLNSLRLLAVVFIPFTTSIDSTFVDLDTGAVYLAVNYGAVVIIGAIQTWYATVPSRGLARLTPAEARATRRDSLAAVILSLVAIALSPLIGALAFVAFAFDPLVSRLLRGPSEGRSVGA
jgi:uncharacterized membrane protein